jgi:hypothetical protein
MPQKPPQWGFQQPPQIPNPQPLPEGPDETGQWASGPLPWITDLPMGVLGLRSDTNQARLGNLVGAGGAFLGSTIPAARNFIRGLDALLPGMTPEKALVVIKQLGQVRKLDPEIAQMLLTLGDQTVEGGGQTARLASHMAINKAVIPRILKSTLQPQTRRDFLKNIAGSRGRIKEIRAAHSAPKFLREVSQADEMLMRGDPVWKDLFNDYKPLINMTGGARTLKLIESGKPVQQVLQPNILDLWPYIGEARNKWEGKAQIAYDNAVGPANKLVQLLHELRKRF